MSKLFPWGNKDVELRHDAPDAFIANDDLEGPIRPLTDLSEDPFRELCGSPHGHFK